MDYFQFLPMEITLDILTRLPTLSVLESKLVCTNWRTLVGHPTFSKMHFHHLSNHHDSDATTLSFIALTQKLHYLEYNQNHNELTEPIVRRMIRFDPPWERPEFVGSCNGLVCLFIPSYTVPCLIFNPIIRGCVELPFIKIDCEKIDREDKRDFYAAGGFGYVSSTDEYKVVAVFHKTKFYYVYIYTLGSGNGWRKLGTFDRKSDDIWKEGSYANDCVYWRGSKSSLVMTFDLAAETFRDHLSPPLPLPEDSYWHRIGVLDGVLFFAVEIYVSGVGRCYDVWLLRKKNDNHDEIEQGAHQSWVWSKEFRTDGTTLFSVAKSDGVLTYSEKCLYSYDTKASTSKMLVEFQVDIRHVFPHKDTLISLKEVGEESTKRAEDLYY